MSQVVLVMLLRQINSSLPLNLKKVPDESSSLSFAQTCLLAELFHLKRTGTERASLSVLAEKTGFSKATVCAALKKLRKTGYIHMQMDDVDNRRKEILLTEQAWAVENRVEQAVTALNRTLCAGIPPEDLQTMEKALQKILQNAKDIRAPSPCTRRPQALDE